MIWPFVQRNFDAPWRKQVFLSPKSSSETLYAIPESYATTDIEQCYCHKRPATSISSLCVLNLLALVAYTAFLLFYHGDRTCDNASSLLPHEIPSAEYAAEYRTQIFEPSSFGFTKAVNKYEGRPTPENNAAWHQLWNVGVYSMTDEEYQLWGGATAQVVDKPDQHIVVIEMFHQLHCVNMIRDLVYSDGRANPYKETESWRTGHIDHCIDYLRQIIMCHGDLTPMAMVYDARGHPRYSANFRVIRTCRNFDKIYDWAAKGNRSGTLLDHEEGDPV